MPVIRSISAPPAAHLPGAPHALTRAPRTPRATRPAVGLSRVLVLTALVLLAFGAGSALAGEYRVQMCETQHGNVPTDGLRLDVAGGAQYVTASDLCGRPGGYVALSLGNLWRRAGEGVRATLNPGVGVVKATVRQRVWLGVPNDADGFATPIWAASVQTLQTPGFQIVAHCQFQLGCRWTGDWAWEATGGDSGRGFIWETTCAGRSDGACDASREGGQERVTAEITAFDFTVRDVAPPLLEPNGIVGDAVKGAGPLKGTKSVLAYTSDDDSGVASIEVRLGNVVVGGWQNTDAQCVDRGNVDGPDFSKFRPCLGKGRVEMTVDTTRVADGAHTLSVVAKDAVGNASVPFTQTVEVDNVEPPVSNSPPTITGVPAGGPRPGDALGSAPGAWTGVGLSLSTRWQRYDSAWVDIAGATGDKYSVTKADVGKKLRVMVRAAARGESQTTEAFSEATPEVKSGGVVQVASLAPTTADSDGGAPQLVVDREQRSVQVKHGAQIVVTGRLVDADARPIADAVVDVFEQVTVVGAPWRKIATVKTDSQGGYSFRPTTTGSRTLRFAYSATRQAGEYRATREVVISVLAGMEIKALRRIVPASGQIVLRGRVRANPLPAAGTWVEVQVLDAGIWRTVATRRTSKTGRWSFTHRVRRTSNVTFAFRARLRQLADVPSIESKSATVKVRVR